MQYRVYPLEKSTKKSTPHRKRTPILKAERMMDTLNKTEPLTTLIKRRSRSVERTINAYLCESMVAREHTGVTTVNLCRI